VNNAIESFMEAAATAPLPDAWYDQTRSIYLVQDTKGERLILNETQLARKLRIVGFSGRISKGDTASAIDRAIHTIQQDRNVHFTGPLAGYSEGLREFNGKRVLVTGGPRIIVPAEGAFETLKALFEGVLGAEQAAYYYGWLRVSYDALRRSEPRPGQAIVFAGPRDCGKSLIQNIVTEILGGRAAKPYQSMTGGTAFNADLFGAEHLTVEDEQPSTDIRARRNFGSEIKKVTVNEWQRLHAKHRDAIMLKPFWRISVSINDEAENLLVLPPLDDSIRDKLMIFHAKRPEGGFDTATPEKRAEYWAKLTGELPAFLHWLTAVYQIPEEQVCPRFGVKGYLNPSIVRALNEQAPEARLLLLIDAFFWGGHGDAGAELRLTAEQITASLTGIGSGVEHEARRLLSWNGACGTYLARIAEVHPERVQQQRHSHVREWLIHRAAAVEGAG